MRILTIETGVRCGHRCLFCFQRDLRGLAALPADPDEEELTKRLRQGRRDGFEGVGFTGGEPTERSDFLRLVALARELGYRRIAVTTNGQRLANARFRRAALDAGLNGVGWSIHGASAETHDGLTGRSGSFERALRGLRATLAEARGKLDPNLFTVVNRANAHELADITARFRELGVRLFILQPPIHSRGTLATVAPLALSLAELVRHVRALARAGREGAHGGFRVKAFNLPPCLLDPEDGERERHTLRTAAVARRRLPRGLPLARPGFVRLSACARCALRDRCPGLHASLAPQGALVRELAGALAAHRGTASGEVWLGGLELFDEDSLVAAVASARHAGAPRVVGCSGGGSVLGPEHAAAFARAGFDAVRLELRRREPRSGDRRRALAGNESELRAALAAARGADASLPLELGVLLERSEIPALDGELAGLVDAGVQRVRLEVAPADPEMATRLVDGLRLVSRGCGPGGWARRATVTLDAPAAVSAFPRWQRRMASARISPRDVRGRFVHSALSGPGFGWVVDSVPQCAVPGDYGAPDRWPARALAPLVLRANETPPARPAETTAESGPQAGAATGADGDSVAPPGQKR